MNLTEIKASKKINGIDKSAAVAYDFGATLEDAVDKFGADVVFTNFKRTAVITAQAVMRRMLEADKTEAEIAETMQSWKPGVAIERVVNPVNSLVSRFDSYSLEEQEAIIAKLKAKQAAAQNAAA